MKIALTADPELPVPPLLYGGIERVVDMLVDGLVSRGHDVTLFAHQDSNTRAQLVAWPAQKSTSPVDTVKNTITLARHVIGGNFGCIHSFSRLAYLAPLLPLGVPKLMTYQRPVTRRTVAAAYALSSGTLAFSAVSNWMTKEVGEIGRWFMIPNGVPDQTYSFNPTVADDSPLVFLGRIEEIKGPHLAIEIARRTGRRLVIAGNVPPSGREWFNTNIAPFVDDRQVVYVGPVDDKQKNILLGGAKALLMPILWDEPFGIVMAEALACGTPVLGLSRGAVPEVVVDGVTGFVRRSVDELCVAVELLDTIDRRACRDRIDTHYSASSVVEAYISAYSALIDARRKG